MWGANLKSTWSQLLTWGAVALGFGALLGGGTRADATATLGEEQGAPSRVDEVMVKLVGEKVLMSQDGSSFEELRLGDTPEAAHLKKLLRDAGDVEQSVSVPIG